MYLGKGTSKRGTPILEPDGLHPCSGFPNPALTGGTNGWLFPRSLPAYRAFIPSTPLKLSTIIGCGALESH